MDTIRFLAACLCCIGVLAASCWLTYLASYWAWFWLGLWGAIPVGIVAGSLVIGLAFSVVTFLGIVWVGGGGR